MPIYAETKVFKPGERFFYTDEAQIQVSQLTLAYKKNPGVDEIKETIVCI
jgi:hypothetical protein